MDTTELLGQFRLEVSDLVEPYLFDETAIYAFIDEAQKQFCRLTEGIEDGRSFSLNIVPNVEWYPFDKRILKLRKAYSTASGRNVPVINQELTARHGIYFDGRVGPLKTLVAGTEKNQLRAHPMPNEALTVQLEVFRLPRSVGEGDVLEIDEQHHLALLDWVKYRAYNIDDAETFDRRKSELSETKFRAYCAQAKAEQARRRRQVGVVEYGGY